MISVQCQVMIKPSNGLTINEPALSHNGVIFVEHHQEPFKFIESVFFHQEDSFLYN